ncbi:3078_t:CDS:2, partial [Diversispora eburnea]
MPSLVKYFSALKDSRIQFGCLFKKQNQLNYINVRANEFTNNDLEALRVKFQPAPEGHVIPNEKIEKFPEQYVCPRINRDMLSKEGFKVQEISNFSDVQTFFNKLHIVTRNSPGIPESRTDALVDDLFRVTRLNKYPLEIVPQLPCKLYIFNKPYVSAKPDFLITKGIISMIIVEDKTLQNADRFNTYGETQMAAELLACGNENIRKDDEITDQVLFAVRFISTYTTFYKADIPVSYWKELNNGLPKRNSIKIKRWPGENYKKSGLDLADPGGRKAVLTALAKI